MLQNRRRVGGRCHGSGNLQCRHVAAQRNAPGTIIACWVLGGITSCAVHSTSLS